MSSIAFNLTRRMEWMGRRLRHIDDAAEILNWVSAMKEINGLLKEVDIKEHKDTWKPWSKRDHGGKILGSIVQRAITKPKLKDCKTETIPTVGLKDRSGSDFKKNGELKLLNAEVLPSRVWGRSPRVEVDGDDVEMLDPKAAVLEMLRATKVLKEKKELKGKLSLIEMKKNREIWRMGMLERVKKEKVPVEHWGDKRSGNFRCLIGESAPHGVRVAVTKEMGFHEVGEFLYKELMKFYDKGHNREI